MRFILRGDQPKRTRARDCYPADKMNTELREKGKKKEKEKKIRKGTIDGSSDGISAVSRANESRDEEKGDSFAEEREPREKGMTLRREDISNRLDRPRGAYKEARDD